MIEPRTTTENLMYSTVRIAGMDAAGNEAKTGTGFFYSFPTTNGDLPILVTNKHVIEGVSRADFVIHTNSGGRKKPDGKVRVQSNLDDWTPHPDPKLDLCAVPVGSVMNNRKGFFRSIHPSMVPSQVQLEDLSAVEEILMVGYPNGLWDETNNFPLMRRGITASHPAVDYDVDGVPATVIDAPCFPGSSGSPVLLHNSGNLEAKDGSTVIGTRTLFLGVLFAGPQMQADGRIVIRSIPTAKEPVAVIRLMMNLGYILKARELLALRNAICARYGVSPRQ